MLAASIPTSILSTLMAMLLTLNPRRRDYSDVDNNCPDDDDDDGGDRLDHDGAAEEDRGDHHRYYH